MITKIYAYEYRYSGSLITFYGDDDAEIFRSVSSYLKGKNDEVNEEALRSDISKTKKPYKSVKSRPQTTVTNKPVKINDAINASLALIKNHFGGAVDQSTFDKRLKTCQSCHLFQKTSDCASCGGMGKANAALSSIKSKMNLGIKSNLSANRYCGFCGCSLLLLASTKRGNYKLSNKDFKRPLFCWLNPKSNQFKNEQD